MTRSRTVRVSMSPQVDDELTAFAEAHGVTKTEAMRRAIGLLVVAREQHEKDRRRSLGVVRINEDTGELEAVGQITDVYAFRRAGSTSRLI